MRAETGIHVTPGADTDHAITPFPRSSQNNFGDEFDAYAFIHPPASRYSQTVDIILTPAPTYPMFPSAE